MILVLCTVAFGVPLPGRPRLLVPVLGAAMSAALAPATAAFTAAGALVARWFLRWEPRV